MKKGWKIISKIISVKLPLQDSLQKGSSFLVPCTLHNDLSHGEDCTPNERKIKEN